MYEVVVRFHLREEVSETADSLERALARVQVYKRQRLMACCRPRVRALPELNRTPSIAAKSGMEIAPTVEP